MKWPLLCAIPLVSLCAGEPEPQPGDFDYDLFRRDVQAFKLNTEFLFWGVYEGGLDYALSMENAAWGPTPSYAQGNFDTASYNWEPGFRVGLSFFRALHYWEMEINYTRLTSRGQNSSAAPEGAGVYLTGTWPQITTSPLTEADSRLHLNYNTSDLLLARVFLPNPHLRMRFKGGPSVAWMNQDWRIAYFDAALQGTEIFNRWKYVGGGLKIGTIIDWYWTTDIYVTGGGVFGAFVGNYQNQARQMANFQPTADDNPQTPIRNAKWNNTQPAFTVQAILGPSWQKNFTSSRVEVFAGYELNIWWNLQQIFRSTAGSPSSAKETWVNASLLALQGLTTRLTVDF